MTSFWIARAAGLGGVLMLAACGSAPARDTSTVVVVQGAATAPIAAPVPVAEAAAPPTVLTAIDPALLPAPAPPPVDAPEYAQRRGDPYHLQDVAFD